MSSEQSPITMMDDTIEEVNETEATATSPNKEGTTQAQGRKKRRQTSDAWKHFTRMPLSETKGKHWAKCNYCGADYASHPTLHGTNQLWRHLARCPQNPNRANSLTQSFFSSSGQTHVFNQDRCRKALARFIIKDEMPFRTVEGEGFQELLQELQLRFQIPSRWTVARDCYKLYLEEAKSLRKYFKRSKVRVSLTTDCWTSVQNSNYMCLTAHWIDDSWSLHKRILNFCVIENYKGDTIGKQIEDCLLKWGIDKVFTITVDNASSNDTAVAYLKKRLRSWNGLVLDGEFLQMRCAAHILNLVVSEGLKEMNKSIELIRHAIKFVRSSPGRQRRFKELVEKERIDSKSLLCLDCPTRWNSTYLMLDSAVKFIKVFTRMEEEDADYKDYFKKQVKLDSRQHDDWGWGVDVHDDDAINTTITPTAQPPTAYDWGVAKEFLVFLKLFYSMTLKFSGSNYVTTNDCFQHIVAIQSNLSTSIESSYTLLGDMARRMLTKYDKYWGNLEKLNPFLVIAVILDPRYKLTYVKVAFETIFPDLIKREAKLRQIMDVLYRLQDQYASNFNPSTKEASTSHSEPSVEQADANASVGNMLIPEVDLGMSLSAIDPTFKKFLANANTVTKRVEQLSEVDEYLQADLLDYSESKFDLLAWWKVHSSKYKVLSLIARDLLAAPVSTVSSESAFSTGGRVIDAFRSSLSSSMAEGLICAQNWLRMTPPKLQEFDFDNFEQSTSLVAGHFNRISNLYCFIILLPTNMLLQICFVKVEAAPSTTITSESDEDDA